MKSIIISAALVASVVAAPAQLSKRANIDGTILNYALTLEHLEAAFYAQGIQNFTADDFSKAGFNGPNFYKNLKEVAKDEATHVSFLTTALKGEYNHDRAHCSMLTSVQARESLRLQLAHMTLANLPPSLSSRQLPS